MKLKKFDEFNNLKEHSLDGLSMWLRKGEQIKIKDNLENGGNR